MVLAIKYFGQLHAKEYHFKYLPALKVVVNAPVDNFVKLAETANALPFIVEGANSPAR